MATVAEAEVDIASERAEIVREALEWQGTHFQHRQQLKSVGCDCVTLLVAIFGAVLDTQPVLPAYQPDEWLHDPGERYAEALRVYFDEMGCVTPMPGDVVSFHFGRRQVSHCGVCVDTDGGFVSATLESGRVEYAKITERYWSRRWTGTWRLKRWAARQ